MVVDGDDDDSLNLVLLFEGTVVADPDGMLVELLSFGTSGEQIAADVREWL